MRSRLSRITNWSELAEQSNYNAKNLAERCSVSLRQLQRFFPRRIGKAPQRWLNDLRQQKALELLTGGQSIKQVAYSLGYKQSSHFTRQFKQFHGLAPSEFLDADFSSGRSEITQVALR